MPQPYHFLPIIPRSAPQSGISLNSQPGGTSCSGVVDLGHSMVQAREPAACTKICTGFWTRRISFVAGHNAEYIAYFASTMCLTDRLGLRILYGHGSIAFAPGTQSSVRGPICLSIPGVICSTPALCDWGTEYDFRILQVAHGDLNEPLWSCRRRV